MSIEYTLRCDMCGSAICTDVLTMIDELEAELIGKKLAP